MTTIQILGLVTAGVLVLWPQIKFAASYVAPVFATRGATSPSKGNPGPNFRDSVVHLSQVRARLLSTDSLGGEQKKAIETLTLALVAGSDK